MFHQIEILVAVLAFSPLLQPELRTRHTDDKSGQIGNIAPWKVRIQPQGIPRGTGPDEIEFGGRWRPSGTNLKRATEA